MVNEIKIIIKVKEGEKIKKIPLFKSNKSKGQVLQRNLKTLELWIIQETQSKNLKGGSCEFGTL